MIVALARGQVCGGVSERTLLLMSVPIAELVKAMKVDKELLDRLTPTDWDSIDATYERYVADPSHDRKAWLIATAKVVGRPKLLALTKTISAPATGAPTPPATAPSGGGMAEAAPVGGGAAAQSSKSPASSVGAVAGMKRGAPGSMGTAGAAATTATTAAGSGEKRQRLSSGYAAASAAADADAEGGGSRKGAAKAGGERSEAGGKGKDELSSQLDPLAIAGVDMEAEAQSTEIVSREDGAADEAARFGSGEQGERLRTKLGEIAVKFGLEGADENAARMIAIALDERLSWLLEGLHGAAFVRTNGARRALGEEVMVTSNPLKAWKPKLASTSTTTAPTAPAPAPGADNAAMAAVEAESGPRRSAAAPAGRKATASHHDDDDDTRQPVSVADVLYLLDGERQSRGSRVVQWWRCNNHPLGRYQRQAARLFAPPPPKKDNAATAATAPTAGTSAGTSA